MAGWESVLAAVGGMLLGLGTGLGLARLQERALRRHLQRLRARARSNVVPVLERRAEALGLRAAERPPPSDDPCDHADALARAIRGFEDRQELPFSDTVDVPRGDLAGRSQRGR